MSEARYIFTKGEEIGMTMATPTFSSAQYRDVESINAIIESLR